MTSHDIDAIQAQLWQQNNQGDTPVVYAILDGARNKEIEKIVRQGALKSACLYEGKLTYKMAVAAPYLVRLEKNHPQTIELIKKGWGNSWGIFAITFKGATHIKVRHNCRKIARVKGPNGKNLIFRYYDPRVLRTYITQCDINEAEKVFGPISEFIVEGEETDTLHRFKRTQQGVEDVHDANSIHIITHSDDAGLSRGTTGELKITNEQFAAFEAVKFKKFIKEMEQHLSSFFKAQTAPLIETEQLNNWVKQNIAYAQNLGFETELDICRYLNVAIIQGESVKDELWLKDIMAQELFPSTKATLLEEKSLALLDEEHQEVKSELAEINQKILEKFHEKHNDKVLGIGVPLYGLNFSDDEALKAWMFRVGQKSIDLGLTDDMALDLWLDMAMRYGEDFPEQPWANLSEQQQLSEMTPPQILRYILAEQPHKQRSKTA